jgi:hypothetical protein
VLAILNAIASGAPPTAAKSSGESTPSTKFSATVSTVARAMSPVS